MSEINTVDANAPQQTSGIRGFVKRRLKWFTKKRLKWFIPLTLVVLFIVYKTFAAGPAENLETETVKAQDIEETVLTTGQVTSNVDLDLSFTGSGKVARVYVEEGDKVKSGKILATLNQDAARAQLTSALGAVAQAKANYNRIIAGSTDAQVRVSQAAVDAAQISLDNAKRAYEQTQKEQAVVVENARKAMMNAGITAEPGLTNGAGATNPTISGTYAGTDPITYTITFFNTSNGLYYDILGSSIQPGPVRTGAITKFDNNGLYFQFPVGGEYTTLDRWTVTVPNTRSAAYLTAKSAYDAAVQNQSQALTLAQNTVNTAEAALNQANVNLQQTLAAAPSADVEAALAQITSAQGQYLAAQATYNTTIITAPMDGTITRVDIRAGELATAMSTAIVLQNVSELHAEANVSEANIASLTVGQEVDYTFDALGPDRHFKGVIESINPASTVVSGVVNYKVTASIEEVDEIKPGMTANMEVNVASKQNVIAVPVRSVIKEDGKEYVRVITNSKKQTYEKVEVKTGMRADGGLVEIVSGLSEGQEIVTYIR